MGENSGQGQGHGETLPQEGDQVQWKWGPGHPQGTVSQTATTGDISIQTQRGNTVKKNADPENPALLITRQSGQDVVKRASEVEVIGHNTAQSEAGEGGGGAQGSSSSSSRKRKEQASTPTKQGEKEKEKGGPVKRGRGRPPKNGNTAKKVRTGKEGDVIASDNEDAPEDDDDAEYDEEDDENQDPEETEDEKEKDQAGKDADADADADGEGDIEGGKANNGEGNANAENLFGSPVVPKIQAPHHGHGHGHGHGHSQSHGAIPPLNPNKTGTSGNSSGKNRSQSASASAGGGGGGGDSTKKGGAGDGTGDEEPKRASIDALLNENGEEDEKNQQSNNGRQAQGHPPRHAKQVAEDKIAAVAAGKEAHPGAPLEVPGAGTGAAAAADDGYNPEVEALLQAQ